MALALSIIGVAFAAFCVWLTVRIVNRRERWAKWTLAAVLGVPALYVASFGPACWFTAAAQSIDPSIDRSPAVMRFYWPIGHVMKSWPSYPILQVLDWWLLLGVPEKHCF